ALVRLEGARLPLEEKAALLGRLLDGYEVATVEDVFPAIEDGLPLVHAPFDIWRIHVPPTEAAKFVEATKPSLWYADWAGSVLWAGAMGLDSRSAIRSAAACAGGHAILVRADESTGARMSVFPEESPERAALTRAVKAAFDPRSLLNRGRMYEGV